jgi:membrane associated rhomboid family serine protease
MTDGDDGRATRSTWATGLLVGFILACIAVELVLQLADRGVVGPRDLRADVYAWGAFWPPLLRGWQPNYALQPWTMFASYAFLHGGLGHLAVNMITLWSLGQAVAEQAGARGLVGLFVAGTLGGAVAQALLSVAPNPMVGASGGLFGLVAGLLWLKVLDLRRRRASLRPALGIVLLLVGINLAMWWALDGRVAWQAHLGGFVAGLALMVGRHGWRP